MDVNNLCNLRQINFTVCGAKKFTTPGGIGILFAKQKFLFGEISGICTQSFFLKNPFALSSMSKGLCLQCCFHSFFHMHDMRMHGMTMGLRM